MLRLLAATLASALAAGADARLVLHVAPAGHLLLPQTADGSAAAPFRSVAEARDALRALQPLPAGGATVLLHEGTHRPFALTDVDSGRSDAPITYAAAPGEAATVSGAVPVPASAFKPWTKGSVPGIVVADLAPLGITAAHLGSMRYPVSEGSMGFGSCQHDKAELFFGGEAQTLARFPNKAADGSWRFLYAEEAGKFGVTPQALCRCL